MFELVPGQLGVNLELMDHSVCGTEDQKSSYFFDIQKPIKTSVCCSLVLFQVSSSSSPLAVLSCGHEMILVESSLEKDEQLC